jgi:hypothetical protein
MLRGGDGCNLLYPRRYELASAPFYALERDGRLMGRSGGGHHEGWTIADLEDTHQDFRRTYSLSLSLCAPLQSSES